MTNEQRIAQAVTKIAGSIFEDAEGTIAQRLDAAIKWKNRGTDADLTSEDRKALSTLREYLYGRDCDLVDSNTAEWIRAATLEEAIDSALARPEGHIDVDGRTCYVEAA